MFQLTQEECLRSQIVTLNDKGRGGQGMHHTFCRAHTIFGKADTNERLFETLYPYAKKPIAYRR